MSSGQTNGTRAGGRDFQAEDTAGAKAWTGERACTGLGMQETLAAKCKVLTQNHTGDSRLWLHFLTLHCRPTDSLSLQPPMVREGQGFPTVQAKGDTKPKQSRGHPGGGHSAHSRKIWELGLVVVSVGEMQAGNRWDSQDPSLCW